MYIRRCIKIEIWKDIINYEGIYQVSNYGSVKSLDRYITRRNGVIYFKKGDLITPMENEDGYYQLKLCENGKCHTVRVHILVAHHFIDKPIDFEEGKYEVNHKDYNRKNNFANNLEWVSHKDNIKYSADCGRYKIRDYYGANNPNYKNHTLSDYYKNNPDISREKQSRPAEQNGRAAKIVLYDENHTYVKTFNWIGGCAEFLKSNGYSKGNIKTIRANISTAIKNNKKYLNHYYNKIA